MRGNPCAIEVRTDAKGIPTSDPLMTLARILVVAACAWFILKGSPVHAQNGTWNNVVGGSWSTPGNWSGGNVADGAGSIADFSTLNITAGRTITLDFPRTIGTLLFGDATTPDSDWVLNGSALTLSGSPTINVANRTLTISLSLTGMEGLTKLGPGTNILTGPNSYSGGTTISAGTLRISSDTHLGMAPGSATPAHLVIDGGTLSATAVMAIHPNRGMALGPAVGTGGGTIEVIPVQAVSVTNNGVIANHGAGTGFLAKTGAGRLVLNGVNSYSGGTFIFGGPIQIVNDFSLGAVPSVPTPGNIFINGGQLAANATMTVDSKRGITVGPSSGFGFGQIDVATPFVLTYGGIIADNGSGIGGLIKSGLGTLVLSGPNIYSGNTAIQNGTTLGTLKLGANNVIPDGPGKGDVNVGLNSILDVAGFSDTFNGLTGSGTVTNSSGNGSLTVGNTDVTTTFSGTILNTSGSLAITKIGTGTFILSGANVYSGGTTISGGILQIGLTNGTTGSIAGNVLDNGSLVFYRNNTLTFGGDISGSGTVIQNGSSTLTLSGNSSYTGTTFINNGAIQVGGLNALGDASGQTEVANGASVTFAGAFFSIDEPFKIAGFGFVPAVAAIDAQAGSAVTLSGPVTVAGDAKVAVSGTSTILFNHPNAFTSLANQNLTLAGAGAGAIQGSLALGTGGLIKTNSGIWTLSGANTYSGDTLITAGTLALSGSGTIAASSTLILSNGATLSVSGVAGGFSLASGQTLMGVGTVSGNATVAGGAILSPGSSLGTLTFNNALTLAGNTVMEINKAGASRTSDLVVCGGVLTYGGTLTVMATGDTLAEGDSFHLFSAGTFSGSFASFDLPALPQCLFWDTATLSVDGTIRVVTIPVLISCPSAINTSICGTSVDLNYPAPTITAGVLAQCTPASGSSFGLGTTPVMCTATNLCSTNSCSFNVTVSQVAAMSISCPANVSTNICGPGVEVSFASPVVGGGVLTGCAPANGSTFLPGTTPVVCTATNLCSTNTCSFDVTVTVVTVPELTITCPANISTNICGANVAVSFGSPMVSGGALAECTPASGSTFAPGMTTVTCTATNFCSTNTCSFNVVVLEDVALSLTCPAAISTNICGTSVVLNYAVPIVSGGTLIGCTPASGSPFGLGVTPVNCTATNRCVTNTCSFDVTVEQIAALTLTCAQSITTNICGTTVQVSYAAPTVEGGMLIGCAPASDSLFNLGTTPVICTATNFCSTNACSFNVTLLQVAAVSVSCPANVTTNICGTSVAVSFASPTVGGGVLTECAPASGSTFVLGTTPVLCTATNLCSTNNCSFHVVVAQIAALAITCPANLSTNICGENVEVSYASPMVSDGTLTGCTPSSGSLFVPGTTAVTCTATNFCSTNTCSFNIVVTQEPTLSITCPASIGTNICGASVAVSYPNPMVSGGVLTDCLPPSGSVFALGTTAVNCTATNLCTTNTCTFNVAVVPVSAIVITCPVDISTNICGSTAVVGYAGPTADGGTVAGCTPASGSTFALGTTPVICTATNLCTTNTCSFDVTVLQVAAVSVSCPANVSTNICGTSVAVSFASPTVGGGVLTGCVPASGSTFAAGTTPVTCTGTNFCSTNSCSFNVTVTQMAALAITCPANISTNICGSSVAVGYAAPMVSGGALTSCTPASGSLFVPGTTAVTCTATNFCSTNTCSFNVAVTELAALSITCPASISTNICGANVAVSYLSPTVSGGTFTGCTPASGSSFPLGTTPVTCTATNVCSTNTCSFNVTVAPVVALSLTCPAAISTNICGTSVAVSYAGPTVSGGTLTGCTPSSGSVFVLGSTPVTCTATNLCSTNTCSFAVAVTQFAALAISCPANVSTNICGTSAAISYAAPTIAGGTLTGCAPASGSTFGLGTTPVTCTATNLCSTNTCSFNVGVAQLAALSLTCPANVSTNFCNTSGVVGYANPPVSGGSLTGCTPASGSTFVLGSTPVTCTATNRCSTNTCSFNVVVAQVAALSITCPANISTNICGTSVAVNYAAPTVAGGTATGCAPASGSAFGLGTTPVTCAATNLCSTNTCSFNVVVAQVAALSIACPANISTNICGTSGAVGYASPAVSGGSLTGCTPPSGGTFGLGTTQVTCTATNLCSTNTCSFNVVVAQIAALSISCPANLSTNICGTSGVVSYAAPTVSGGTLRSCTPASGSTFALGTTPVTCTATNLCSTNTCSFNVAVAQIAALAITCPANVSTNICGSSVAVTFAAPTVSGGTLRECAPSSGSTFAPGTTPVTCTATNACSTNTCSFNVAVTEIAALAIACPADVSTNICGTTVAVSYAAPTVSGGTWTGCAPSSGSTFAPGITAVTCTATNRCSTNTCSFNVAVTQVAALSITCPANLSTNICGTSGAVSYPAPTVTGGTLRSCTPASGSSFALGTTPVTCTATNLCSTNTCSFNVAVAQVAAFSITCPANVTTNICGTSVGVGYPPPPVSGGVLRACAPSSGSTFALGVSPVTCTATNLCSTNTCTFNVTVAQAPALSINCPADLSTNICGTSGSVSYASPTITGGTLRACTPASGSTFAAGTTPVTCTATNLCSTNTCSFNVAVAQVAVLSITCPGNVSTNICSSSVAVSYPGPTVSGGALRACTPASGSTFAPGTASVTCTATNLCTTNTCSFNVNVTQLPALSITCPANVSTNICGTSSAVSYAAPTVSGGTLRACVPASGSSFALGITPVTCTATNACSTNTCSFNVAVTQVAALSVTCPANISTNVCDSSAAVNYANPTVSGGVLLACTPASGSTFAAGTTPVTCTATNLCSTNTCSFNVVVAQIAVLSIACPADVSTNICGSSVAVSYPNPTVSGGTLRACTPASGSAFSVGTTAVACTATNLCETNTCSFDVQVAQLAALSITCPSNVSTNICTPNVAVSYAAPTVSGGALRACTPASGSTFGTGTTAVTCTATNHCSTNTCSFNVAVTRLTTLSITCPGNLNTNMCGSSGVVNYAAPTIIGGTLRACTPASGSVFAVGATPVTCTATNICATDTCSFNVVATQIAALSITCPANVSTNICASSIAVSYPNPTVTGGTSRGCTPASGSTFAAGTTPVTCTATNVCSTNTCSFNVVVTQVAELSVTCPANLSTNICTATVAVSYAAPTVSGGALRACTPASGTTFAPGTTAVTCTATNRCSTNTCSFNVAVTRITTLSITCPGNLSTNICGSNGTVNYAAPTVNGGTLQACTPASGSVFAVGTTPVTCTGTNLCSTNTCSFNVVVGQIAALAMTCPANVSTNICGESVAVIYAAPTLSGGTLVGCVPASGSMFALGTNPVTCTATNICSTNTCSFNVAVTSAAPLAIVCPANISTNICDANVAVAYASPTVSGGTLRGCAPASGSTFAPGTTPVICTATNLCSTNTCSFNVEVVQIAAPVLNCPANISTNICGPSVAVSYADPTVNGGVLVGCTPPSGSPFALGTTSVICTSTNLCSTNTCSFNVQVAAGATIVLTCPADILTNSCGTNLIVNYPNPAVSGGVLVGCAPASGTSFGLGTTSVVCTATNSCSTNVCSFSVVVNPAVPPLLSITVDGPNVVIKWPEAVACSYVLEQAGTLPSSLSGSWSGVMEPVTVVSGSFTVTIPIGSNNKFFRLRFP